MSSGLIRFASLAAVLCGLAGMAAPVAAQDTVEVSGRVLQPGSYTWAEGSRLRDAAVAGQVRADAYFLAAALLRESAREPQQRLRTGVLFDLSQGLVHAQSRNDQPLQELLQRLQGQIEAMPVTGRVVAEMNPLAQQLLRNNPPLRAGDRLIYPARPDSVRVMGAVQADCSLAFDPGTTLLRYLRQCPRHAAADPAHVYLIQPNGVVQRVGVAHHNAEPASVAVGAVLLVPVNPSRLGSVASELNEELAAFLATQHRLGGRFDE